MPNTLINSYTKCQYIIIKNRKSIKIRPRLFINKCTNIYIFFNITIVIWKFWLWRHIPMLISKFWLYENISRTFSLLLRDVKKAQNFPNLLLQYLLQHFLSRVLLFTIYSTQSILSSDYFCFISQMLKYVIYCLFLDE